MFYALYPIVFVAFVLTVLIGWYCVATRLLCWWHPNFIMPMPTSEDDISADENENEAKTDERRRTELFFTIENSAVDFNDDDERLIDEDADGVVLMQQSRF